MSVRYSIQRAGAAAMLLLIAGCGFVSQSRYRASQTQNRALAEQNKAQLAEIENLKVHTRSVEDRLIEAERTLAARDAGSSHEDRAASRAPSRE